ncbi:glycosyltransferase [Aeoliella sp. ICT_H6.2]|uniref:Glycosyltransferase n=1 Tax=Aeoliella straminimaris TaxID=2954799 RepID=A0A9X2FG90_9BACT|nr:glycosyltransferase [Aeoliella straminimaris]MCO6047527.1 glycosyltransferase [Aeoliella straminimaris]
MWPLELEVPRLGELARQFAGVSAGNLRQVLELQQKQGGRVGALMLRAGLLSEEQLTDLLRRQARWVANTRSNDLKHGDFPLSVPFSICMPCYNEAQVLGEVLTGALAVLPEFLDEFEIVIVDDGSQDQTSSVVQSFAEKDDRIRLVRHEVNRGYGASVATGLRAARGDLVFFTDGDGQFNLLDLPQLLVEAQSHDVVVGYRYDRADHAMRRFNAFGWKMIIRTLMGLKIRDLDCAFKVFPRRVIDKLRLDSEGACISAEIMCQCARGGVTMTEVPVNHYPRSLGKATGANLKVITKAFRELPVVWKYRKLQPWVWNEAPADPPQAPTADPLSDTATHAALSDTLVDNGDGQQNTSPTSSVNTSS